MAIAGVLRISSVTRISRYVSRLLRVAHVGERAHEKRGACGRRHQQRRRYVGRGVGCGDAARKAGGGRSAKVSRGLGSAVRPAGRGVASIGRGAAGDADGGGGAGATVPGLAAAAAATTACGRALENGLGQQVACSAYGHSLQHTRLQPAACMARGCGVGSGPPGPSSAMLRLVVRMVWMKALERSIASRPASEVSSSMAVAA